MRFEFATATRVLFGSGVVREIPKVVREFGNRALLVTGRNSARAAPIEAEFEAAGIDSAIFRVEGEPTLQVAREGVQAAREGFHFVVGFGGGSAMDAAKAIAALTTNSGEPLDYLEGIGHGRPLKNAPLPFVAIPTTAGTGAEVTRNAVIGSPEHGVKASLRSPLLLAKLAVIDPDLTADLPSAVTATTGLDALTQLIEPFVSSRTNPLTDLFCREGLNRVSRCLLRAFRNGEDRDARESMSFASLLGGLALANAGLGVVHGFAAPLGGMLEAPHGALVSALLPHSVGMNIRALRERAPDHPALQKYDEVAQILNANPHAKAEDAVIWLDALCKQLEIVSLKSLGLEPSQIPELVDKASKANSMKSNPIPLSPGELAEIAENAL
ncbi:MAG: iron-containing alcohol dehydrogenase [Acidobacteriaceae bacterium]|nr:iron-containing alcohol dehydrogenase [Acidobacteriaceae bacterium]